MADLFLNSPRVAVQLPLTRLAYRAGHFEPRTEERLVSLGASSWNPQMGKSQDELEFVDKPDSNGTLRIVSLTVKVSNIKLSCSMTDWVRAPKAKIETSIPTNSKDRSSWTANEIKKSGQSIV